MIPITELLDLTLFDDFELIAGKEGLNNRFSNIVILEYETYNKNYSVFSKGDFVLTSLFFAKDNPKLIEEAIMNLIKREVSGIAVKTIFFHELPIQAIELANAHHTPIFFFEQAYMEDLIIGANELLKSKLQYLVFEEKVASLVETTPSVYTVAKTLDEINKELRKYIVTAYLTPIDSKGQMALSTYFQRLVYKRYKNNNDYHYSYIKYKNGMFLVCSSDTKAEDPLNMVQKILKFIDLDSKLYIGISDTYETKESFNIQLKQAIYCNRVCQMKKSSYETYSNLGMYALLCPLLDDPTTLNLYTDSINTLLSYDHKYTSNLMSTLIEYIKCNGEISKTAANIFQHPNTVRYRLKKASSLLNCSEDNLYNFCFIIINLYLLRENSSI